MKLDLEGMELIGEGSYAKIYKYFSREHKTYLCARLVVVSGETAGELDKEKEINRELMKLSNPYILKIYGIEEDEEKILYTTEYCEGGSLFHCLDGLPNHILELYPTISIALKIARGIQVLHNNKITHRDLKPENILLVRKYKPGFQVPEIKIADFGLSTNSIIMETIAGTKEYLAPEQAKFCNYTNAVDVWALGIIIDEMLHGNPYFVGENNEEVFKKLTTDEYLVRDKTLPNQVQDLLTSMLKKKAFERTTIGEIIHKLQSIEQQLKTAKISTLTLKSIRSGEKNWSNEFRCSQHNSKVIYIKEGVGYCEDCVKSEVTSVEEYLSTLPSERQLLFQAKEVDKKFELKWNLDSEIGIVEEHKSKFKELKTLFQHINTSTLTQSSVKSLQQNKRLRFSAQQELITKYQSITSSLKQKLFQQLDSELQGLFQDLIS